MISTRFVVIALSVAFILGDLVAATDKKDSDSVALRNLLASKELNKMYRVLLNNYKDQYLDGRLYFLTHANSELFLDADLLFGRNYDKRDQRVKYADSDYGHMRFGK